MNWAVFAIFATMVVCFLIRMPISFSMLCSSIVYFLIKAPTQLGQVGTVLVGNMFANYTMLAAPLFIFMANVLNESDITDRMFSFCNGLLGRLKGGTAQVNVFISLIFSGMTGSAIADASGLGKMEIEAMRNEGYDDGFSCAITAASATIGPIFPPSIPMVIYSMLSGASVGALFMGGMVPAVLLALALMLYVAYTAHRRNYPVSARFGAKEFLKYTVSAIPAILTPVILLVGIYTGVMTPTEAGAVAGLYALIVAVFGYRILKWDGFKQVLIDTVKGTGTTSIMIGAATTISYIVAKEHVAEAVANFITGFTDNKYVFLIIVNIAILLLGMFIDTSVIQVVFVPILLPIAKAFGIDLVHFGLVVIFNMMIGLSTPPFGMLLFITSGISGTPLKEVIKEIMLPLAAMIVVLLVITYVPDVVLFLPRLLMNYAG